MSLRWVIVVVLCAFCLLFCRFFFSSRRRHTRWPRDWSSDVCSSDLSSGQGAHAQNKTLSLGHGNGMASVKQVKGMGGFHDHFIRWQRQVLFNQMLALALVYIEAMEQKVHIRVLEVEIGRASCRERGE